MKSVSAAVNGWLQTVPQGGRSENQKRLTRVAEYVQKKAACFLCGAGMSKASGLPLC